jgi:NADH-quinone oxidoreductase subunit G
MLGRGQLSEIGLYTNNILVNELSSNIIDFCPVGALTNKNFALNYRSWDSHYIDSIDIMDTFLSSIRIYTDNLKIKRILSNYNNNFDVYWISDKSRYFFDSLKIQRLTFPLIKKKEKKKLIGNFFKTDTSLFISSSWKNISNYLKDFIILSVNKLLIKSIVGDFIDIESLNFFKYFTFKLGSNNLINNTENSNIEIKYNYVNFDQEINYINSSKIGLHNYDFYIFYNYNLRIENPVLNSKLRQKVIWFNFNNLYFFGTNYNLTYKYYHLSNTHTDFVNFLFGKHWLCNILLKFNNIVFLYGNTIFNDFFIKNSWSFYLTKLNLIKKKLFTFKNKQFDIFYLTSSITTISSFDLLFLSKSNFNNISNSNNLNYYIGINQLNFKVNKMNNLNYSFKNSFFIYQNSFFDNNFKFCNIMLPVYTCFELENQYFINCMGLVKQNIKVEINLEEFLKSNIDALNFIFKIINSKIINKLEIKLIDNLLYYLYFNFRRIMIQKFYYKFLCKNFFIVKYKNFHFISINKNFYKSNIYGFYSKQLNMMSNLFFKEKSNFEI